MYLRANTPLLVMYLQMAVNGDSSVSPLTGLHYREPTTPQIAPLSPFVESEFLGRLHFYLGYDFRGMTLNLKLVSAESLPAKDFSGTSDPYVKIMLLPDRKHQMISNIKRKSLNPHWNELFAFEGYTTTATATATATIATTIILWHFVWDYLDEPVPEETFTHSHLS